MDSLQTPNLPPTYIEKILLNCAIQERLEVNVVLTVSNAPDALRSTEPGPQQTKLPSIYLDRRGTSSVYSSLTLTLLRCTRSVHLHCSMYTYIRISMMRIV